MADRYTVIERLDQGGMAEVFRGVAEGIKGFRKSVAIKRILPNLTRNRKFVAMFLDEARLSLHLQHANIVHVFDIGMADTTYFLVMEYVDGINLKGLIDYHRKIGRRVPVGISLWLISEVLKGLAYAHDFRDPETGKHLGIVHRDMSPPNVLISRESEVKLVDFGLAKASSQLEGTDPGVVKGKFAYLSPEAASGIEVDHRADIFACGTLLWELLAGQRLFFGDNDFHTVELVRAAEIPSLREANTEIDAALEEMVLRALTRDPDHRYQHASDFHEVLVQHLYSHGFKVSTREVKLLVAAAMADRDRDSGRAGKRSLIDTLIKDEIHNFTSLPFDEPSLGAGSPVPERGADAPLDPHAFVKVDDWAAEFSRGDAGSRSRPSPEPKKTALGPTAVIDIEQLQHLLEPDRTGMHTRAPSSHRGLAAALAVALLVVAGLAAFFLQRNRQPTGDVPPAPPHLGATQ
ncbi:MAG: serine/threonine protein kinase [Myxococcales bacterium]|nr:serine/threonine protein kinase [Myxococcales bacterium]